MYSLSGDMFTLRVETILIGDVVDGVLNVGERVDPGKAATNSQCLVFSSLVDYLRRFLMGLTIREFVSIVVTADANVVGRCLFDQHHILENGLGYDLRSGISHSNDDGESNELQGKENC